MMEAGGEIDFSFISKESMKNQFCTDLYTKVGEQIQVPGTTIHVFYALKMGEKYRKRYLKYFANPDICEYNPQHEELLLDAERWTEAVVQVYGIVKQKQRGDIIFSPMLVSEVHSIIVLTHPF